MGKNANGFDQDLDKDGNIKQMVENLIRRLFKRKGKKTHKNDKTCI